MSSPATNLFRAAIGTMVEAPAPIGPRVEAIAALQGTPNPTPDEIASGLVVLEPNDPAALEVGQRIRGWDHVEAADWTEGSSANTADRRHVISERLAIYGSLREAVDSLVPPYLAPGPIVITASEVEPWYTYEAASGGFYWKEYVRYLTSRKGWANVQDLDRSTFSIVANLTNPALAPRYQAKGLVVGHVQSGKTANFTGVIARAADAGYRLVIVLTGTTNILRHQTQRRIDKELIGRELLGDDYASDPDWLEFVAHGGLPSALGAADWLRLTGPLADYHLLGYGGPVLDFKRLDPSKPFYDPKNTASAPARIMIVKKHAGVLGKVAKDLTPYRAALAEVPVLVIDDESDQASLDTTKPNALETKRRTAVNRAIRRLLSILPRAQYVGYTATPFANVFVDPDDEEDLFPRDFIVALDRPPGYMGASDFHDLDGRQTGRPSNEEDFVRAARGPDEDPENLPKAIDSFVLAGGLKLYREFTLGLPTPFRHHTMLIHVSQTVDDHSAMRDLTTRIVADGAYRSPAAVQRLRRLWEDDFRRVSGVRGPTNGQPQTFEELLPFVAECVDRVFADSHGILIVNGQKESDTPDFDRENVWRILIGGNKLSRGYTIEGLTVSYYRRRADAADTLMQMGRWFGYREGYQDLVRLFIGREESKPNGETIDLYLAFEAVCRDEMAFRSELRRYAGLPGEDRIRPVQVPPLVQATLLRPTSPNKMYNAELLATNLGGDYREPTLAPSDDRGAAANLDALATLLGDVDIESRKIGLLGNPATTAYVAKTSPAAMVRFLSAYKWSSAKLAVKRDLEYLAGNLIDPELDSWIVVAPQLQRAEAEHMIEVGGTSFTVKNRQRDESGGRYAVYSEPDHVKIAKLLSGVEVDAFADAELETLLAPRQGAMLLYPVQWYGHESIVSVGFALSYPPNSQPKKLVWSVVQKGAASASS